MSKIDEKHGVLIDMAKWNEQLERVITAKELKIHLNMVKTMRKYQSKMIGD